MSHPDSLEEVDPEKVMAEIIHYDAEKVTWKYVELYFFAFLACFLTNKVEFTPTPVCIMNMGEWEIFQQLISWRMK